MDKSFWNDKQVFVSGAGGFIGSHLTEALLDAGARVRALVKYNSRNSWGHLEDLTEEQRERCHVVLGDVTDPFAPRKWLEGCEMVFHLAALIGIPYSYVAPGSYVDVNVRGTVNLLEAARDVGVTRFLHTSTSEVYGTALRVPIDEEHPLQGQSPYSASKMAADKMVESYCRSFDFPGVVVRPFNTFGPRQSARAVIPTIITQALACDSISLGSLDPIRDLTFVKDTALGFLACAEAEGAIGKVLNLGTGSGVSIGELADTILKLMGVEKEIKTESHRVRPGESEVMRLISDPSLVERTAGWRAQFSLEEGLAQTIDWIKEHLDEYKADSYAV